MLTYKHKLKTIERERTDEKRDTQSAKSTQIVTQQQLAIECIGFVDTLAAAELSQPGALLEVTLLLCDAYTLLSYSLH